MSLSLTTFLKSFDSLPTNQLSTPLHHWGAMLDTYYTAKWRNPVNRFRLLVDCGGAVNQNIPSGYNSWSIDLLFATGGSCIFCLLECTYENEYCFLRLNDYTFPQRMQIIVCAGILFNVRTVVNQGYGFGGFSI